MKVAIGSDHAGYNLKLAIIKKFEGLVQFEDFGCDNGKTSVDYPDVAQGLCKKFTKGGYNFGILVCGSGIGISIAANRFKGIRAALCHDENTASLARQHNNANIICLGARILTQRKALKAVKAFLDTKFLSGRHQVRVEKLN